MLWHIYCIVFYIYMVIAIFIWQLLTMSGYYQKYDAENFTILN